jgi:hypothetical protein
MPLKSKSTLDFLIPSGDGAVSALVMTAILPARKLTETDIRIAMKQTVLQHPRLSFKPLQKYFSYPKSVEELEMDIRLHEKTEYFVAEKELERALNEPMLHYWRLCAYGMERSDDLELSLVFTLDQQLGDAKSMVTIVKTFLRELISNRDNTNNEIKLVEDVRPIPIKGVFSSSSIHALVQLCSKFRSSSEKYTDKPVEGIQPDGNGCISIRLLGGHAEKIQAKLAKENQTLEAFITVTFLTCFRQLVESTTSVEYNPVRQRFQHLFTFVLPVAIMIVLCYQQGADSWAWIPSLLAFLLGRKFTKEQTIKLNCLTFGYSIDSRTEKERESVGNYLIPFVKFDYALKDSDLFWSHVPSVQSVRTHFLSSVSAMNLFLSALPSYFHLARRKRDIAGIISVVEWGNEATDYTVQDMQIASSIANPLCRSIMDVTIAKRKDTVVTITYPSDLFSFADIDLFTGQLQGTMIKALRDPELNLEHQIQK